MFARVPQIIIGYFLELRGSVLWIPIKCFGFCFDDITLNQSRKVTFQLAWPGQIQSLKFMSSETTPAWPHVSNPTKNARSSVTATLIWNQCSTWPISDMTLTEWTLLCRADWGEVYRLKRFSVCYAIYLNFMYQQHPWHAFLICLNSCCLSLGHEVVFVFPACNIFGNT